MKEIANIDDIASEEGFFLPHHGVLRAGNRSRPLRVVFNGSQKTDLDISLNDVLYKGGVIQEDLFSIMLRARKHAYFFSCEQIEIHPHQKHFQKNSFEKSFSFDQSYLYEGDVLSQIARIFGPLGFLGPVISKAKFFMQQLWLLKLEWHEKLPVPVAAEWASFVQSLPVLEKLKIPRFVLSENLESLISYGFSDALEKGFGDVTYVSVIKNNCARHSQLLCSKSRVAPLKILIIPRFLLNSRSSKNKRVSGPLSLKEINQAEFWLIKLVQKAEFSNEIKSFLRGEPVHCSSKLSALNCFVEENNIIRVGGRLKNSPLSKNQKYPTVLPSKHAVTLMIIKYYHIKYLHVGPNNLLYHVRQKYWPLNDRNLTRQVVHNCVICFKNKPILSNQIMGDLPKKRVTPSYPFNNCGVDFCGPFMVTFKNQRKGILNKVYVLIFVCLATKAIQLDFVSGLTSKASIACLKRFFGRGKSSKTFSDNGKTFVY
ncbi:integrase catalytic domain-containing protein [Trichonephila clavipes]|nr:integrase catalytic domain-containing protein [Trichonephila clavipes]